VAVNPKPVDIHVGARVRLRRTLLGMTQTKLGDALGLTFQQVQKNERGTNRIGSSRLFLLSKILDVPVSFFFDDMAPEVAAGDDGFSSAAQASIETDSLARRETLELVRAYYKIPNPIVRKRLFNLVKALGGEAVDDED
jgi:transcriptional regulator with XRE-family HTH domain